MKPIKDALRREWVVDLHDQLRNYERDRREERFVLQAPSRGQVTHWIGKVWVGIQYQGRLYYRALRTLGTISKIH
jgi:hypothetical protein